MATTRKKPARRGVKKKPARRVGSNKQAVEQVRKMRKMVNASPFATEFMAKIVRRLAHRWIDSLDDNVVISWVEKDNQVRKMVLQDCSGEISTVTACRKMLDELS